MSKKLDNSTFHFKRRLRRKALEFIDNPVVLETHGGYGKLYSECYHDIEDGIVFEKDAKKADALSIQRPTWAVYQCDCVSALSAGAGNHLPVNFLDIDPYGEPWSVIDAFFESDRDFMPIMAVVVNDGLRQKVKISGGWDVEALTDAVMRYGASAMYKNYVAICREMVEKKVSQQGYSLTHWTGYYCGHAQAMTHYAAILNRDACPVSMGAAP